MARALGQAGIVGKSFEVTTMYREFAEQAVAVGDASAADWFSEVRGDEQGHRDAFKAALQSLKSATV